MILPFAENSFGGSSRYTAVHGKVGDTQGKYSNYRVYMYRQTTTGVPGPMFFADAEDSLGLPIADDTTWMFTAYIVARRTDADNESAAYWIQGAADNNGGTTALVGVPIVTALEDTVGWNVTAVAGLNGLGFTVTGGASKTIRWNGYVDIVQVSG
jgi:hypothetical protein